MDRIHLMSTFVAVVDAKGFAGAGRKLNLSPPAVSRAIGELESRLGVQLLARTTRVVQVTDAGAQYAEDCRRILADVDRADEAASDTHASARGQLLITAPAILGRARVMPVVTEYLRNHPNVRASCWFIDRVVNMVDEGVDVAIRVGELPDSSLHAYPIGRVARHVCASPRYLASHASLRHPRDLAGHSIISTGTEGNIAHWTFAEEDSCISVKLPAALATTTSDAAISAALDGFGVVRLLSYEAMPYVQKKELEIVLAEFEPRASPVHLLYREGRRASAKVRSFIDFAIPRLTSVPWLDGTNGSTATPFSPPIRSSREWDDSGVAEVLTFDRSKFEQSKGQTDGFRSRDRQAHDARSQSLAEARSAWATAGRRPPSESSSRAAIARPDLSAAAR